MAMYHPKHSNGNYEMATLVQHGEGPTQPVMPRSTARGKPGYDPGERRPPLRWVDLTLRPGSAPLGPAETEVRLSYDWSAVPEDER